MRHSHFDILRTFLIITVFLAHAADWSFKGTLFRDVMLMLSPGMTMCLLGYLSAILLTGRKEDGGVFLLKRMLRIFVPLYLCNGVILLMQLYQGTMSLNQDTVLHFMGLSLFFNVFQVEDRSSIGAGLWFITAILLMYFMLPLLRHLFHMQRARLALFGVLLGSLALETVLHNSQSFFAVLIGFSMGVYHQQRGLPSLSGVYSWVANLSFLLLLYWMTVTPELSGYRYVLLPLYPLLMYPWLLRLCEKTPSVISTLCERFSKCSFEFYLLHFYFLSPYWTGWYPPGGPVVAVLIGFIVTLILSLLLYPLSQAGNAWLAKRLELSNT